MSVSKCRECTEPNCDGCNRYSLEVALDNGYFDSLMDGNKFLYIDRPISASTLNHTHKYDKNGREILVGDKVNGVFLFGMPVVGVCDFSEKELAYGIKWKRGDVDEFYAFCKACNIEWEVVDE